MGIQAHLGILLVSPQVYQYLNSDSTMMPEPATWRISLVFNRGMICTYRIGNETQN